ncbi:lipopolysaccharide heptosyltransferase family protein [Thiospirochaeta perfilievii]|uniref:Lipopolysaccharide heptosyltransferase family protein n=1 Tax=Thiospirochaeta perfilievii TaxID=252967 RepID=A0A5C1QE71_9SPIO|nr:glycosyltransferase family 9 protein [Thiospirochaeta perfilievii]QEN05687.1 lipopolysaccharide heptosyltransferase family protein [Thiospirochaeta perfilievii]
MCDRGNSSLRFFDRYLGIPIVFLLGLFHFKRKKPERFNSVGVLATAAIGDTLLISPILKDLKKRYPGSDITIFCGKTNKATFEMALPSFKLVVIPVNNPLKSLKIIRSNSFDIFIDFGPWPRLNSILSYFAKSKYRVGFKSINQHRHFVYDKVVDHLDTNHEIDNLRRVVKEFDVVSESIPSLGDSTPNLENPYVVVHMFPSGYKAFYKEWSDYKWVNLINGLTDNGINVKLTGAPVDVEPCNRIVSSCKNSSKIEVLAGKTNLKQAGEVLQKSTLVISVNTGIMHMAAAYNKYVIGLHGPTSPLRWGPICNNKTDFTATTKGAGCLHLGFEYVVDDVNSLDSIDESLVLEEAVRIYKGVLC